jgi:hypothetical protein
LPAPGFEPGTYGLRKEPPPAQQADSTLKVHDNHRDIVEEEQVVLTVGFEPTLAAV